MGTKKVVMTLLATTVDIYQFLMTAILLLILKIIVVYRFKKILFTKMQLFGRLLVTSDSLRKSADFLCRMEFILQ